MSYMFYNCSSLKEFDCIKKWNVENVEKMDFMFCECKSLISVAILSDWNVSNLRYLNGMFKNCKLLNELFDVKKWEKKIRKKIKQVEVLDGCDLVKLEENKKNKIKEVFSKLFNFLRFKCFDKLYFPFIYLIKLIVVIIIGFFIFIFFRAIYYSFSIKETNKFINNPNEYLNNYFNKTNITRYEEKDDENELEDENEDEDEDKSTFLEDKIFKICEYTFEYFEKAKNNTQKFNIFLEQFNKTIENISEEGDITLDSFLSKNFSENITNKTEENNTRNFYQINLLIMKKLLNLILVKIIL